MNDAEIMLSHLQRLNDEAVRRELLASVGPQGYELAKLVVEGLVYGDLCDIRFQETVTLARQIIEKVEKQCTCDRATWPGSMYPNLHEATCPAYKPVRGESHAKVE